MLPRIPDLFLYKKIQIPKIQEINQEIEEFYSNNMITGEFFKPMNSKKLLKSLPTLNEWFNTNNVNSTECGLISMRPLTILGAHIDQKTKRNNTLAFNFPVRNCKSTFTRFYKNKEKLITNKFTDEGGVTHETQSYIDENPEILGEYYLDEPVILNIMIPHIVFNPLYTQRVCLSFRFLEDPWHLIKRND